MFVHGVNSEYTSNTMSNIQTQIKQIINRVH